MLYCRGPDPSIAISQMLRLWATAFVASGLWQCSSRIEPASPKAITAVQAHCRISTTAICLASPTAYGPLHVLLSDWPREDSCFTLCGALPWSEKTSGICTPWKGRVAGVHSATMRSVGLSRSQQHPSVHIVSFRGRGKPTCIETPVQPPSKNVTVHDQHGPVLITPNRYFMS